MTRLDIFREFGPEIGQSLYLFARNHCHRTYKVLTTLEFPVRSHRTGGVHIRTKRQRVTGFYPDEILSNLHDCIQRPPRGIRANSHIPWRDNYERIEKRLSEIAEGSDYPLQRDTGGVL